MSRRKSAGKKLPLFPSVEEIASFIHVPVSEWAGQCFAVASLASDMFPGSVPRYGHYYGPVSFRCKMFNHARPFQRHGWIEVLSKVPGIIDPTRWVFECKEPYLFVGESDDYDPGGQRFNRETRGPFPSYMLLRTQMEVFSEVAYAQYLKAVSPGGAFLELDVSEDALLSLYNLTGFVKNLVQEQIYWIAHVEPDLLGDMGHTREVYSAIHKLGFRAMIPIDYWQIAFGSYPHNK